MAFYGGYKGIFMINLQRCKECLDKPEFTDEYFLKIHFYLEGIFKRIMLFGLRKLKMQYKTATKFIRLYNSGSVENLINDTFEILRIDNNVIKGVSKFDELKKYVIEFSSKYRNLRVHGLYDKITNHDLLQALIGCDYYFIKKLETILKRANIPSFYEKPSTWGIKKGTVTNVGDILIYVKLSGFIQEPKKMKYSIEKVLETINYLQSKDGIPLIKNKSKIKP
jgi:hypothetical protein